MDEPEFRWAVPPVARRFSPTGAVDDGPSLLDDQNPTDYAGIAVGVIAVVLFVLILVMVIRSLRSGPPSGEGNLLP